MLVGEGRFVMSEAPEGARVQFTEVDVHERLKLSTLEAP